MKHLLLVAALVLSTVGSSIAAENFKIDEKRSKVEFVGKKSDGEHKGGFKSLSGEAVVDHENHENGSIELKIETKSLWSDDAKLTEHLKNQDFFNIREYPEITFKSTKVAFEDEGKGTITGDLTMLGKTVETDVPTTAEVDKDQIKLIAKFKIDRTKWGMKYGEGKVEKDVELVATIYLVK